MKCTTLRIFFFLITHLTVTGLIAQSNEPCNATELQVGAAGVCTGGIAACINPPAYTYSTNASSGVTLPPLNCNGFTTTTRDFWYRARVPQSGQLNIRVTLSGDQATERTSLWDMAVYTSSNPASCAGSVFTQIASECGGGTLPDITISQPAGTLVYIRMFREAAQLQTAKRCYRICATDPPTVPPSCSVLTSPVTGASNVNVPATFNWTASPSASSYNFYIGTTNPPDSLTEINDTVINVLLDYNTTYYWTVVPKNVAGKATGCTVSSFTTMAEPSVPDNDDCEGAITIKPSATITGYTINATQTRAAEPCGAFQGSANDDVWYKFVPVQNGDVAITLEPYGNFDAVMIGYSGNCNALTPVNCVDATVEGENETLVFANAVAGTNYYFRVYGFGATGSEGYFNLTASGTALSVTMTSLKAEANNSTNTLSWTTIQEQNNKGFEVERSGDNIDFQLLSFVNSKANNGSANNAINYSYIDRSPLNGTNYYRLKQVDLNGKTTYSNVVAVKKTAGNEIIVKRIYPNPVKDKLNVEIYSPLTGSLSIIISDLAGKILSVKHINLTAGINKTTVDVINLTSGVYMIKQQAPTGSVIAVSKFIKE